MVSHNPNEFNLEIHLIDLNDIPDYNKVYNTIHSSPITILLWNNHKHRNGIIPYEAFVSITTIKYLVENGAFDFLTEL